MAVFDLFSKRQKRLRGEMPDVYTYDKLPEGLRNQIIHIALGVIGNPGEHSISKRVFTGLHDILCREYGRIQLMQGDSPYTQSLDPSAQLLTYFVNVTDTERALDVVELLAKAILGTRSGSGPYDFRGITKQSPAEAIEELNTRFQEHGVGYRFESGEIIRIDSQFVHSAAVKPTLLLLQETLYKGANEEFLAAHEHYRHGRYKECTNECLKAFESVLKVICSKRKWQYDPKKDAASKLIDICLTNNLIPSYLQSQFQSLRSLLECGVPTVRSKVGAHGQGTVSIVVPQYLASYALHLTATNILFLAEADKAMP